MKRKVLFSIIFLLTAGLACGQDLVATTSVLSSVVEDIAKDKLNVETLVPAGSCPGHFDLKVRHLQNLKKSGILFAHGFEVYLKQIEDAVGNPLFGPVIILVDGNWLIPENQKQAYKKVAAVLAEKFPQYGDFFEKNRQAAYDNIEKTDTAIKKLAGNARISGIRAVCNSHIKEVLEYAGFEVAATYGRKEELTPAGIKNLIALCREKNVRLIVDNLQAGSDTGRIISNELKIPHLAISNFPGVFPGTPTLRQTLEENVKRMLSAYETAQNKTH